jgi:hypothetical protein
MQAWGGRGGGRRVLALILKVNISDGSEIISLLAEVSICAGNSKEKRPLPRSDSSSVHDRGRVKPVCKTSSETGLEKQIVRMYIAELRCNDIEPVVSKWRLGQRGHFEVSHVV